MTWTLIKKLFRRTCTVLLAIILLIVAFAGAILQGVWKWISWLLCFDEITEIAMKLEGDDDV